MENDNEGVGAPSGPRVLASRSLRPKCYRVTSPIRRSLAAMSLFGFLLPEELRGLDRDGFDVAIAARFAVNEDFELSAEWISNLRLPYYGQPKAPRRWRNEDLREH